MTEKVLLFVFGKNLSILSIAFLILLVIPLNSLYSQALQPSPDSVSAQGLVAYYPFNGNANDESGNVHDGVLNGAILVADRCGNANSAFKFNGKSDYIDIGEFGEMNDLSISMWFRSDTSNQNSITFGSSTYANTIVRLNLRFNDVSSRFYYLLSTQTGSDNELYGYVEGIPNDSNWHHFVFTRSGNSIAFFLDGQQRSITAVHAANIQSVNTHKSYFLGAENGDDPSSSQRYYFNGCLDDIRIYNRALTGNEIQELYRAESGPAIYDTQFRPSKHGFYFANGDFVIGRCLGMTYAAAYFFDRDNYPIPDNPDCNGPTIISCGDKCPLPPLTSPLRTYITALQARHFVSATLASIMRWMENPVAPSHFFEHHYDLVKDYLMTENFPRPIFVSRNGGNGHALLVYKIEDLGNIKKLYVYDSNGPGCDNCFVELEIVNGNWIMHDYNCNGNFETMHNMFAALRPMNKYLDSPLGVILFCPVDLEVHDSRGNTISKNVNDFNNAIYLEDDVNGDGVTDKAVLFDSPEDSRYSIHVIPEPGASESDSFTILCTSAGDTLFLLQNLKIRDIPTGGFNFWTIPVGSVSGTISDSINGLLGLTLNIYDSTGTLWQSLVTDDSGYYHVDSIPNGKYSIAVVTPLGYQADQETKEFTIYHVPVTVNFSLTKIAITPRQRSRAYWADQLIRAIQNKPQDYTLKDFSRFTGLISVHFNHNQINPVDFYSVPQPASQSDSLVVLKKILLMCTSDKDPFLKRLGKSDVIALMLNVVSGKINQTQAISADGRTVSQAITYCDMLVNDEIDCPNTFLGNGIPGCRYILADAILTLVNFGLKVPKDLIPADVIQIAYKIHNEGNLPTGFTLEQNYPNPFNPKTQIEYALPKDCNVKVMIYNILGQKVMTLVDEFQTAGFKTVIWDGKDDKGQACASGIYFYKIQAGEFSQAKKMVLMK